MFQVTYKVGPKNVNCNLMKIRHFIRDIFAVSGNYFFSQRIANDWPPWSHHIGAVTLGGSAAGTEERDPVSRTQSLVPTMSFLAGVLGVDSEAKFWDQLVL